MESPEVWLDQSDHIPETFIFVAENLTVKLSTHRPTDWGSSKSKADENCIILNKGQAYDPSNCLNHHQATGGINPSTDLTEFFIKLALWNNFVLDRMYDT